MEVSQFCWKMTLLSLMTNALLLSILFNHYFRDITNTLPIRSTTGVTDTSGDPLFDAISKFSNHPSIVKIRSVTSNDVDILLIFKKQILVL